MGIGGGVSPEVLGDVSLLHIQAIQDLRASSVNEVIDVIHFSLITSSWLSIMAKFFNKIQSRRPICSLLNQSAFQTLGWQGGMA